MTGQEKANRFAEESIKRWGFVVVSYKRDRAEAAIGKSTPYLWNIWKMSQPFVPIRFATPAEWSAQVMLFQELFGYKPEHAGNNQCPVVLVTD